MSKIPESNYTQIPNVILDELMPLMSGSEMKVTLAIARKTFGWQKRQDQISISQLMELTGLSKPSVRAGIQAGIERGTISRTDTNSGFVYSLVLVKKVSPQDDTGGKKTYPPLVKKFSPLEHKRGKEIYPTKESIKETIKKEDVVVVSENSLGNIATIYENEIGLLTATISDELQAMMEEYPNTYIEDAIKLAATANKRNLRYVKGILKNWRANGKQDRKPDTNPYTPDAIIERQANDLPEYMQ